MTAISRGRPRSQAAKQAVLESAFRLAASGGLRGATIEGIARASGVSKVTIYRWWANRSTLLSDAILWRSRTELPIATGGDPVQAVHQHVQQYAAALQGDFGKVVCAVVAESLSSADGLSKFREQYLRERRRLSARVISRGQKSGVIPSKRPALALALALYDQIYGAIFYRFIFGLGSLNKSFLRSLVNSSFGIE